MSSEEVDKKVKRIITFLEDAQTMFLELKGEKSTKLNKYPQNNIDKLINGINDDFLNLAIENIKGEF